MTAHRYILEKYQGPKTRHECPGCGKKKEFSRCIDTETGQYLAEYVGRCNREINCGYHVRPRNYFEHNPGGDSKPYTPRPKTEPKPPSCIAFELFQASLKFSRDNKLIDYLHTTLADVPTSIINDTLFRYFIGTSKHWEGATVFWQVDTSGDVRAGKIMLYSASTGKRVKEPYTCISWVHKALKLEDYVLKQCSFGEHLLKPSPSAPVAIVESEKTALIASIYFPQYVWLAVGSLTNLTPEKCLVLKGREVYLFPDLNGYKKWENKARELQSLARFYVSDLLECNATPEEREQGLDLADYLVRLPFSEFHHL